MCCYFYSLFAKIVKITATKVMFKIIEIYNANNMYSQNSTINTTSLSIAKAMKFSGNTLDCLFSFTTIILYSIIQPLSSKQCIFKIFY